MGRVSNRVTFPGGSFIESSIQEVKADEWRSHGVRYRLAWVQNGKCRVLFDNHHGKKDHRHIDGVESSYEFKTVGSLWLDFRAEVKRLGGP